MTASELGMPPQSSLPIFKKRHYLSFHQDSDPDHNMGSSSSCLGSDPSRTRVNRTHRRPSSLFHRRPSTSHNRFQIEDQQAELLVNSAESCEQVINSSQSSRKEPFSISDPEPSFPARKSEAGTSSESNISVTYDTSNADTSRVVDSSIEDSSSEITNTENSISDGTREEAIRSSSLGFLVSGRERGDGSVLHVDVVSISSNVLSSRSDEMSGSREARRNGRRMFWDTFSGEGSRRRGDSPTVVSSTDDNDDLGSHGRWLFDFGGDLFEDGVGGDSRYSRNRRNAIDEPQRQSQSEIWQRIRGGLDEVERQTTFCPSGLHPDGTCSCGSFLMGEESGARSNISRIVMLAEALFEVLDEIHRQPLALSLSVLSLPAPVSVVDSFPLKNHSKPNATESGDAAEQCYICLAEYEEGDKIRVLPCRHEYHMSCVDKWLKEIHGVCPLCRGDVREGVNAATVENSETPSLS